MNKSVLNGRTTAIGSLPHPFVDAALQFAFDVDLPFVPQLPAKNAGEYMIPQALGGLPGLVAGEQGQCTVDEARWRQGTSALRERTDAAFSGGDFSGFEPDPESWSGWRPFLYELEERNAQVAKVQLAGPLTTQWVLNLADGRPASQLPELSTQVFRLILAKALAMVGRLKEIGVQPVLFLDEPGLYGFDGKEPLHRTGLAELGLFIQSCRKEGAWVGLHCCSNTDWRAVLELPLDWISFDSELSLPLILPHLEPFMNRGGRLALGLIPSGGHGVKISAHRPDRVVERLFALFEAHHDPGTVKRWLGEALFTPACGLALHSVADAEAIRDRLGDCAERIRQKT